MVSTLPFRESTVGMVNGVKSAMQVGFSPLLMSCFARLSRSLSISLYLSRFIALLVSKFLFPPVASLFSCVKRELVSMKEEEESWRLEEEEWWMEKRNGRQGVWSIQFSWREEEGGMKVFEWVCVWEREREDEIRRKIEEEGMTWERERGAYGFWNLLDAKLTWQLHYLQKCHKSVLKPNAKEREPKGEGFLFLPISCGHMLTFMLYTMLSFSRLTYRFSTLYYIREMINVVFFAFLMMRQAIISFTLVWYRKKCGGIIKSRSVGYWKCSTC